MLLGLTGRGEGVKLLLHGIRGERPGLVRAKGRVLHLRNLRIGIANPERLLRFGVR
jgi:hypothetical protein